MFTEMLDSKSPAAVCQAVGKIHAQLVEYGFPLVRIHADAGKEFTEPPLRKYTGDRGIMLTHAPPTEHNSNGRVENAIKRLKSQVRINIQLVGGDKTKWALAFRAASATWRTATLKRLGLGVKPIVPFGTATQVLVRHWLRKNQRDWGMKATQATVLAPATSVRHGYVVAIGNKLSIVTKLHFGEGTDLKLYVESELPPLATPAGPRRRMRFIGPRAPRFRLRGKSAIKALRKSEDNLSQQDQEAAIMARGSSFDANSAKAFLCASDLGKVRGGGKPPVNCQGGSHFVFGMFRHGGCLGLTRLTRDLPGFAALLARLVREVLPSATFTTVVYSVDAQALIHKDRHNDYASLSHLVPLAMPTSGGRLWTQLCSGDEVSGVPKVFNYKGVPVAGQVRELGKALSFRPGLLHATEPWPRTQHRLMAVAYTVGCWGNLLVCCVS